MPTTRRHLIDNPYSYTAFIAMMGKAKEAGWTRTNRSAYSHQTSHADVKYFSTEPRPVRVIHFADEICFSFNLKSRVFCVVLMSDGTITVDKHLVGLCPYCGYHVQFTTGSVLLIQTARERRGWSKNG
jgi:hypothetical protein